MDFRKEETRFLNKLEEQKGYGKGHFGLLVEDAAPSGFEDTGFTDMQLAQVTQSEHLVSERDEEISKIVETIGELAQIMKDLSVLVVEQGTILDRYDMHQFNSHPPGQFSSAAFLNHQQKLNLYPWLFDTRIRLTVC